MRSWLAAVAIGCLLTLAACTSPTSTGREIAWHGKPVPLPQLIRAQPAVGDCYTVLGSDLLASEQVPCSEHHRIEVAYIGAFTGSAAAHALPPAANSSAMREAYARCAEPTAAYIGGDWHEALTELELLIPDVDAWHRGDRSFRCELLGMSSLDYAQLGGTDMSFRGALAKPTALSVGCITWLGRSESGSNFEPVPCTGPHRGEYVGVYTAPDGPWPATFTRLNAIAADGCKALVARFVGFPSWQQFNNPAIGYYEFGFQERQWDMGDRSVRCYAAAYTKDGNFVGSVKGIKTRSLKG